MSRTLSAVPLDDAWARLVDDAAIFPPGDAPLHEATAAYGARSAEDGAELVGTFVLRDTDLPLVRGFGGPLSVVVTGGAGQLAGPVGLCAQARPAIWQASRSRCATSMTPRATPGGSWPRSARSRPRSRCTSSCPQTAAEGGWLAAADVVAEAELRLKFRTGGLDAAAYPTSRGAGRLDRRGAGPRDAVQVHGRAAQRGPAHGRRRLRAPRLRQRAGRDPARLRRRLAGRGGRCAGAARRRGARGRPQRMSTWPAAGAGSARSGRARWPNRWRTCAGWGWSRERVRARPPAVRRLLGRRRAAPRRRALRRRGGRLGRRPARRDRAAGVRRGGAQPVHGPRPGGLAADP